VEPLARWAKLAMTVQAITCLMILGLVIARGGQYLAVAALSRWELALLGQLLGDSCRSCRWSLLTSARRPAAGLTMVPSSLLARHPAFAQLRQLAGGSSTGGWQIGAAGG
jgi:hypothetical protein